MRLLTSFSVVIGAGLVAAACTDPTAAPSRLSPPSATLTKSANRALTYPNSRKYRDAGFHPASATAGSATISTRSLLGKSGTTDVEVTTGTFDGPTNGTLSSVQVKGYDPKGVQLFTSTNNGLSSSTASFPYTNLTRGSGVQVKANVRNGAKNDVVTVTDAVHLRPDPMALRIEGPGNALMGSPVVFNAFIMERNGDVGARISCVLYIDGSEADRSDGLWIDAGGVVNCAMAHSFNTAGTHSLEMRVENVRPGDYDDSNNKATASIQIARNFQAFSLDASSTVTNSWSRYISTLTTIDGIEETWDQTVTQQGQFQSGIMVGVVDHTLIFPVAMHGRMETNGTTVNVLDQTLTTSESAYWFPPEWGASCATSFGSNADLYICTFASGELAGISTIQYDWWGADVKYHSNSYVTYFDPTCQNNLCERYVVNDYNQVGPMFTFGPDFTGWLSVQGAGDDVPTAASATVTFSPLNLDYDYSDPGCSTTPVSMSCSESHIHITGIDGFTYFGSAP